MLKSGVSGELRYFAGASALMARPPKAMTRPRTSLIGNITVMVLNVGPERMTALQDPAEHKRLFDAIASRNEARIRKVFADVFEDGRREVAAAVAERDEVAVARAAE